MFNIFHDFSLGSSSNFLHFIKSRFLCSEIEKYSRSVRLVSTQWTYTAEIGGKPAKGINIRIFAIPEIHAR